MIVLLTDSVPPRAAGVNSTIPGGGAIFPGHSHRTKYRVRDIAESEKIPAEAKLFKAARNFARRRMSTGG